MKVLSVDAVRKTVRDLCIQAGTRLPDDVLDALVKASEAEDLPLGREVLGALVQNANLARESNIPICQDTGVTYVFLELGQDLRLVGGDLNEAVTKGVSEGYVEGYLRKSVVKAPLFDRSNTGDNTPPVIHVEIVPGSDLKITVFPKGAGSENMSVLAMLTPSAGVEGVKKLVLDAVDKGGANACPPLVVGVGIGGMMDTAAYLAKKAVLRPLGTRNPDPKIAGLEDTLLREVNALGIGPCGLGGSTTALAVHIETYPTHIGALPCAVNLQCHAARRASAVLKGEEVLGCD
jgi:fumarate hydratase subunit alpha